MKSLLKVAGYLHPPLQLQFARSIVPQQIASIQAFCQQRGFDHVLTVVETAYDGQRHFARFTELIKAACRLERPCDLLVVPWWTYIMLAGPDLEEVDAKLLSAGVNLIAINDRIEPKHDALVGADSW